MNTGIYIAVLGGLGGMLGWGFADFFAKKTIDQIGDVASLAWGHIFGSVILILMACGFVFSGHHVSFPTSLAAIFSIAFFGVLQAIVYYFVYKGFSKGQVSLLNPIFASFSGLTALMSIIFFRERIGGIFILSLIAIFVGVLLMNIDFGAMKSGKVRFTSVPGFKEIAIATILASFWTLFWSKLVGGNDWLSYALLMYVFMTFAIVLFAGFKRVSLGSVPNHMWKYLVLIGICETVAYGAISIAYSITSHTSIIALLSGAFSLPTIILGYLFLKERVTFIQTVGSLIIIIGIIILSVV